MNRKNRFDQPHWENNASRLSQLPLTESQKQVRDDRIDEHEANPNDVEPWEAVRHEILGAARQRIREGEGIPHEDFWENAERLPKKGARK